MTTSNTAGRGLAIAAGVILATGTLAILFEDVLMHGAQFTLKHWLTLVTVSGTMMVGHLADLARRARHWVSVIGFAALFLAGTGLVVYSSVGRQAEKTLVSGVEHDQLVAQRLDLEAQIQAERIAVNEKRAARDAECADGDGNKCKAKKATAAFYENSLKGLEARLQVLEPAKPVSAEAEQFATVAAALGYDKDKVRALAILLSPFLTTLFLEFGTIVSFGFAFSPKRLPKSVQTSVRQNELTQIGSVSNDELTDFRDRFVSDPEAIISPRNDKPNNGGLRSPRTEPKKPNGSGRTLSRKGRGGYTKDEAAADLVTHLAFGGQFASQNEIAERYGIGKSTASEWLREWEEAGLIPARTRSWKNKALAKA